MNIPDTAWDHRSAEGANDALQNRTLRAMRDARPTDSPHRLGLVTKLSGEIVVFVTTASEEEAAKVGRAVVEEGLAACVNIVPRIRSIFRWQGQVSEEAETLMVVKTRAGLFDALAARVKALHSYDVPEVIAVPVGQGSPAYLSWIREVTRNPQG